MSAQERRVNSVSEYRQAILSIGGTWANSVLAFRGHRDSNWPLQSSAERRLSGRRLTDSLFIEYHEDLLEKCTLKNYDKREGTQLHDLEMLADLQHHRAATCLLDFTRNALVALWFACEGLETDGRVFVVNTADEGTFLELTAADMKDTQIAHILKFETRKNPYEDRNTESADDDRTSGSAAQDALVPNFWYWTPAHLNERITAQHSLFLFGAPSSTRPRAEEIIIESARKEQMRQELKELDNIHEESLFPDFVGFAYTQRHDTPSGIPGPREYLIRGIETHQRREYPQAIKNYTKAIDLDPEAVRAYRNRGIAYGSKGDYDRAIQDFNQALTLDPDNAFAYRRRGIAYGSKGDYDRAIQDFNQALTLDPDSAAAYRRRGIAFSSKGDHDRAIQDFNQALVLDPDNAFTYRRRGIAFSSKGDYDRAIQDFNQALVLDPDNAFTYRRRGIAHSSKGDYDRAIQDFNQALTLDPDNAFAYRRRGIAHGSKGDYDRAIQDFNQALALDPDSAAAYCSRGIAHGSKGDYDRAIQDFNQALTLDPDSTARLLQSRHCSR